jgi:plasmid stability protein
MSSIRAAATDQASEDEVRAFYEQVKTREHPYDDEIAEESY